MDEKVKDKIRGTILGSACANALGGSVIGLNRREIVQALGVGGVRNFSKGFAKSFLPEHEAGAPLADTFLALALAESVIESGGNFDDGPLTRRFTGLLENEEFLKSAPGAPCLSSLRRLAESMPPLDDHSQEAMHDSGAARAYPLGCLPDKAKALEIATKQAALTQGDKRVWAAAAVIADSVGSFVRGRRLSSELDVRSYVLDELELARSIDERFAQSWDDVAPDLDYINPACDLPYSLINVESTVDEAVPTAVGIFLIFRHSFEEAVCQAASAGGDTDTASAIVGALAGAYHGASAIPERFLDALKHRERLERVAQGLIAMW